MGKNDFFLEPDDAQTMGDINYMRKSVRVRRTFPKTLKNKDGFAVEKQVSATEDISLSDRNRGIQSQSNNFFTAPAAPAAPATPSTPEVNNTTSQETNITQPTPTPEERRQTDTSMDMFLNMARNIRNRR
ncbi:MAG: hypothetical protein QNJ32_11695 [Xenococcaceae cyanobacterium MO_167.B27]|nr:hypothetical protein [Xenococcaceae cyanobacterium MO_167.B27]